jgi:hypothetical protein
MLAAASFPLLPGYPWGTLRFPVSPGGALKTDAPFLLLVRPIHSGHAKSAAGSFWRHTGRPGSHSSGYSKDRFWPVAASNLEQDERHRLHNGSSLHHPESHEETVRFLSLKLSRRQGHRVCAVRNAPKINSETPPPAPASCTAGPVRRRFRAGCAWPTWGRRRRR